MKTNNIMLPMVERLMNELAGIWIDALGLNAKVRIQIREDFGNLCPGIKWIWVKNEFGKLAKIKVIGLNQPPQSNGEVKSISIP